MLDTFIVVLTVVACEVIYPRIRHIIRTIKSKSSEKQNKERIDSMEKKNYCYSFDNEHFYDDDDLTNAKTQEEVYAVAQQLMQDNESNKIWIGTSNSISAKDVIPSDLAEDVIYKIGEYVYSELCGDAAEDYLTDVPKALEEELDTAIAAAVESWIVKHKLEPSFYYVTDIKEICRDT